MTTDHRPRTTDQASDDQARSKYQGDLLTGFTEAIWAERLRAHAKHRATSMEQAELLAHRRASILMEEAAECAKALNDHEHGRGGALCPDVIGPEVGLLDQHFTRGIDRIPVAADPLDRELIQTGAMAYAWWANRRGDRLPPAPTATAHTVPMSLLNLLTDLTLLGRFPSPGIPPEQATMLAATAHRVLRELGVQGTGGA